MTSPTCRPDYRDRLIVPPPRPRRWRDKKLYIRLRRLVPACIKHKTSSESAIIMSALLLLFLIITFVNSQIIMILLGLLCTRGLSAIVLADTHRKDTT